MNKILIISALFASIIVLSGCSIGNLSKTDSIPKFNTVSLPNPSTLDINQIKNWFTYTNSDYKFTLKYPKGWQVSETPISKINSKDLENTNPSVQCLAGIVSLNINKTRISIYYRTHGLCTVGGERTGLGNTPTSGKGTITIQGNLINYQLYGGNANGGQVDEIIYNDVTHEYFTINNKLDILLSVEGNNLNQDEIREVNTIFSTLNLPQNIIPLQKEKDLFTLIMKSR